MRNRSEYVANLGLQAVAPVIGEHFTRPAPVRNIGKRQGIVARMLQALGL